MKPLLELATRQSSDFPCLSTSGVVSPVLLVLFSYVDLGQLVEVCSSLKMMIMLIDAQQTFDFLPRARTSEIFLMPQISKSQITRRLCFTMKRSEPRKTQIVRPSNRDWQLKLGWSLESDPRYASNYSKMRASSSTSALCLTT